MSRLLSKEEVERINSIFREYPDKVANIALHILRNNPTFGNTNYGFKGDLSILCDAELSKPEDVRIVLNFVKKHINDGTFELITPITHHYYISREDGKVKTIPHWFDLKFNDIENIKEF